MTTVDTAHPLPDHWVERAEDRAQQSTVDGRRVLLALVLFVPLVLGAVVGWLVRAGIYAVAAFAEGYAIGRGKSRPAGRRE